MSTRMKVVRLDKNEVFVFEFKRKGKLTVLGESGEVKTIELGAGNKWEIPMRYVCQGYRPPFRASVKVIKPSYNRPAQSSYKERFAVGFFRFKPNGNIQNKA